MNARYWQWQQFEKNFYNSMRKEHNSCTAIFCGQRRFRVVYDYKTAKKISEKLAVC